MAGLHARNPNSLNNLLRIVLVLAAEQVSTLICWLEYVGLMTAHRLKVLSSLLVVMRGRPVDFPASDVPELQNLLAILLTTDLDKVSFLHISDCFTPSLIYCTTMALFLGVTVLALPISGGKFQ